MTVCSKCKNEINLTVWSVPFLITMPSGVPFMGVTLGDGLEPDFCADCLSQIHDEWAKKMEEMGLRVFEIDEYRELLRSSGRL